MSSSIVTESDLNIKIREGKADARRILQAGRFYWTNARFPKELDRSKHKYTESPLRSFHPLGPLLVERELLRVSTDTSIQHKTIDGGQKRGRKRYNYKRLCYLASYDESTNQGVIFLGTSKQPDNVHRFVIVHSRSEKGPPPKGYLGTEPPNSFKEKNTYLNISHPLRVQLAYFQNYGSFPRTEEEGILYGFHEPPPLVSIANLTTQSPDVSSITSSRSKTTVVFEEKSEQLFWEKVTEYHQQRLGRHRQNNDSGGAGPDDDSSGTGPNDDNTGARPDDDTSGAGPSDGGPSTSGARSSIDGLGLNSGGGGGGFNRQVFSLYKAEDAPWGRVGDQRIGIDIPLVTEEMYSDDEMNLEEFVRNSNANDAPWGRVGDQRIGIDIPLVIEDICSDTDEEMDFESHKEFQEVDNIANIVKLDFFDEKGITTGPSPSDDSSWSYTIRKPYFVIFKFLEGASALLFYDHLVGEWRWMHNAYKREDTILVIEGLCYEGPLFRTIGRSESVHRIFNWHTKNDIILPSPTTLEHFNENFNWRTEIVGMIVDTSVRPYAFKVIEGRDTGTIIYDSTTHSWTHRPSVRPPLSKCRFVGNANVASCKGIVFIITLDDWIVLYDMEKDKWDRVPGPTEPFSEQLCGIGSWDDRVFASTHSILGKTFEIQELVGTANPEWKKFDAMPGEMYSWLFQDPEIDVSYCSENLLIWVKYDYSAMRFVLCNMARKTWEKLELSSHTLTDLVPWSELTPELPVQVGSTHELPLTTSLERRLDQELMDLVEDEDERIGQGPIMDDDTRLMLMTPDERRRRFLIRYGIT